MSKANVYYPGQVIEKTEISLEWLDMSKMTFHLKVVHPRTPGTHVSGVIQVIAEKRRLYKSDSQVDDMPTVVLLGVGFEEAAVRLYMDIEWQPGEVKRDGITGSPDGNSLLYLPSVVGVDPNDLYDVHGLQLDEFKLTYKSLRFRQDIRGEETWMMQVMSYLWMDAESYRASDGMFYARLHVMWCCNDYQMPFRPVYIRYLIRFTEDELKRNWAMMLRYKQFAKQEN